MFGCLPSKVTLSNNLRNRLNFENKSRDPYVPTADLSAYRISGECNNFKTLQIKIPSIQLTAVCAFGKFSYVTDLSSVAEGEFEISVTGTSADGKTETQVSKKLIKDTVAPIGALSVNGLGLSPSKSTLARTISVTGNNEFYSYKYKLTSSSSCQGVFFDQLTEYGINQNSNVVFLENALNRICIIGSDKAGNWQTVASESSVIRIDTRSPAPVLNLVHASYYNSLAQTPVFSWNDSNDNDGGSGISHYEVSLGSIAGGSDLLPWTNVGNVETIQLATDLTAYSNLMVYPSIRSVDNVGFVSEKFSSSGWYVGTPAVDLSMSQPNPSSVIKLSNRNSFIVNGTCSEVGRNVVISITGLAPSNVVCTAGQTYSKTFNLGSIGDGAVTIGVFHDNAMSVSRSLSLTIQKDTVIPTVSFSTPADKTFYTGSNRTAFTIAGTCSESGKVVNIDSNFGYSAQPVCSAAHTWSITLNLSQENASSLIFSANHSDAAGNSGSEANRTFINASTQKLNTQALAATGLANINEIGVASGSGKILMRGTYYDNGVTAIMSVNSDGTELTAITPMRAANIQPFNTGNPDTFVYSPSKNEIFFRNYQPGKTSQIFLSSAKIDGSDFKDIQGTTANKNINYTEGQISHDGEKIVFLSDRDFDERFELYISNVDGSNVIKLNGALGTGQNVASSFLYISEIGKIVYIADQDTLNINEIYVVNADGTGRVKLNPSFDNYVPGQSRGVTSYKVNSLKNRVVFYGDFIDDARTELYTYDLVNGGSSVRIHDPFINSTQFEVGSNYIISPDGLQVAYNTDSDNRAGSGNSIQHLWVAKIDGSSRVRITPAMAANRDIAPVFAFSADSTKVVFTTDNGAADNIYNIYVADADKAFDNGGGNGYTLVSEVTHDLIGTDQAQGLHPFSVTTYRYLDFTPDGLYVIASVNDTAGANPLTVSTSLWRYKLDGTEKLCLTCSKQILNGQARYFEVSPDSSKIVFFGDADVDEVFEVFTLYIDGSNFKKISEPILFNEGDVNVTGGNRSRFIDWNLERIYYLADRTLDSIQEAWGVNFDGSQSVRISGSNSVVNFADSATSLTWTNDGERVVYLENPVYSEQFRLYSNNKLGTDEKALIIPTNVDGNVKSYILTPNSQHVVVRFIPGSGQATELRSIPINGSAASIKITPNFINPNVEITTYYVSPDSNWVVFTADAEFDNAIELFAVRVNGTDLHKLSADVTNPANQDVSTAIKFSPDSQKVAFQQDYIITDDVNDMFVVDLETGANRVCVSNFGTYALGGVSTATPEFSYDSSKIIFMGPLDTYAKTELYSSNVDGTNPVKLSRPYALTTQAVSGFVVSANSNKVVYRSDDETDGLNTITAVNNDGSNRVTLTSSIIPDATFDTGVKILPSGKVVFRVDHNKIDKFELFSVDFDGTNFTKLNTLLDDQSDVMSFKLNRDENKVIYLSDQTTIGQYDLFAVNPDGTSNSALSNVPAPSNVRDYVVNNTHVVYRSDEFMPGTYDLYFVDFSGNGKKKISPNHTPGSLGAGPFVLSPVSGVTYFSSDLYGFMGFDLFRFAP